MTPTVQASNRIWYARPCVNPSFLCNIIGCNTKHFTVEKGKGYEYSYTECKRCGERNDFTHFSLEIKLSTQPSQE